MSNMICTIREDLVREFPNGFVSESVFVVPNQYYEYRWIGNDEETFQILARNEKAQCTEYQNANSVDFDF